MSDVTPLPFSSACPVIYDNDDHRDVYTDEYLIALMNLGDINLAGMITSYPFDRQEYAEFISGRSMILSLAKQSGLSAETPVFPGPDRSLTKPDSGNIADTVQIGSQGGKFISACAQRCSPESPLVLILGGPLTVAADAYLISPNIANKIVVAALCGSKESLTGWNGSLDPWASVIVLSKFRCVLFPETEHFFNNNAPIVPKDRIKRLPKSKLAQWMLEKHHPTNHLPRERDGDGAPAISLICPNYIRSIRRISLSGATQAGIPCYQDDPSGNCLVVMDADQAIATDEFWRAMTQALQSI